MSTAGLLVTLLDPVITSRDAATASQNQVLPFIPGAMILGAAARNYSRASDAFRMFHSGEVRFGDALPYDDKLGLGLPTPKSLYSKKESTDRKTINLSRYRAERTMLKPLSFATFSLHGTRIPVPTTSSLKSAIDFETGKTRDGQLFNNEGLAPGLRFWATIEADSEQDLNELRNTILPDGRSRLGRSRSAEFGRVDIEWTEAPEVPAVKSDSELSLIWATSDISLDPDVNEIISALGISGEFDKAHSFYKLRDVWPYNSYWRSRGIARSMLERGSVIAIRNCALKPGSHTLGLNQEIGCGRVVVSPKILSEDNFVPDELILGAPAKRNISMSGQASVYSLIKNRIESKSPDDRIEIARASLNTLGQLYERAAGIAGGEPGWVGPSPTQWGAIESHIRANGKRTNLFDGEKSIAKEYDKDWEAPCGNFTFREWLMNEWRNAREDPRRIQLVAKAARTAVANLRDGHEWRIRL